LLNIRSICRKERRISLANIKKRENKVNER